MDQRGREQTKIKKHTRSAQLKGAEVYNSKIISNIHSRFCTMIVYGIWSQKWRCQHNFIASHEIQWDGYLVSHTINGNDASLLLFCSHSFVSSVRADTWTHRSVDLKTNRFHFVWQHNASSFMPEWKNWLWRYTMYGPDPVTAMSSFIIQRWNNCVNSFSTPEVHARAQYVQLKLYVSAWQICDRIHIPHIYIVHHTESTLERKIWSSSWLNAVAWARLCVCVCVSSVYDVRVDMSRQSERGNES